MDWFDWQDKFKMLLDAIPSVGVNQSILYIIRDEKDDDFDPSTITNAKERVMYQVALEGADYRHDNCRVWEELKARAISTMAYEWIKDKDKTSDGRGAWLKLLALMEGDGNSNKRLQLAIRVVSSGNGGVTYCNEYLMTFTAYSSKLHKAYNVIERYRNKTAPESKVQRLLDGIKIQNNTIVAIVTNHVRDNLLGKWEEAVAYISIKMGEVFPPKEKGKLAKARKAFKVRTGRGRGGPGRGRGRGRGRGGRDNGRKGLTHGRDGKVFSMG